MKTQAADRAWESLASIDPYYAVLTYDRPVKRDEFFASGEAHIAHVCEYLRFLRGNFHPKLSVDFGCGVGRLLVPLSKISESVIGIDVSPTMLRESRANLAQREIENVFLAGSVAEVPNGVDFIHSCIVFQHIAISRGEKIFASLLSRLVPGGVGAIEFALWRNAAPWRLAATWLAKMPVLGGFSNIVHGKPFKYPRTQVNYYSLHNLIRILNENNCCRVFAEFVGDEASPEMSGAILYFEKTKS